jgi:hypothetical protein
MPKSGLLAVTLICAVLLSGCATAAPPVSSAELAQIRSVLLDEAWRPIATEYPEALRPQVPIVHTVTDHDWSADVVGCLQRRGYIASVTGTGFSYDAYPGETPVKFTVEGYICTATFAKQSAVFARLSASQQNAFDGFQVTQVQPCLRLAGARTTAAPSARLTGLAGWSPYDDVWRSRPTARALSYLEQRCPPIPQWMNLDH